MKLETGVIIDEDVEIVGVEQAAESYFSITGNDHIFAVWW